MKFYEKNKINLVIFLFYIKLILREISWKNWANIPSLILIVNMTSAKNITSVTKYDRWYKTPPVNKVYSRVQIKNKNKLKFFFNLHFK